MKFIKYEGDLVNIKYIKQIYCSEIELIFTFDHHIDVERNMFYLAGPGDNTHSIILSDFIEFLREKNDLLFDLSWHENKHKPRES